MWLLWLAVVGIGVQVSAALRTTCQTLQQAVSVALRTCALRAVSSKSEVLTRLFALLPVRRSTFPFYLLAKFASVPVLSTFSLSLFTSELACCVAFSKFRKTGKVTRDAEGALSACVAVT